MIRSNPATGTRTALAAQVAAGALTVPVNAEFGFERGTEVFAALGGGALGKIAITLA
ncbi:hypothetical protein [Nocardia gamkensis]|uniref:Uncharacterized protein n=1 Tax=Nocardia gamkensis TaxID=352869 RepID=A0A7X6R1Y0_9NOCA|nr:hypothetical protein [Nocardia gamkensis]NKY25765.1 hypothetical protein [Nocardia gamkensis]NQE69051.1 hypothetical protein [Nocardia gamkensis]